MWVPGAVVLLAAALLGATVQAPVWATPVLDRRGLASTDDIGRLDRPLPQFVNVRRPQEYHGSLSIGSTLTNSDVNVTIEPIRLHLFSVVPDVKGAQVHLLFEFMWLEMLDVKALVFSNCSGSECPTDVLPHLSKRSLGDLHCEFIGPDGRVLPATPTSPVVAHEVDLANTRTVNTFVATCTMPDDFLKMLVEDDYDGISSPQVRVLRQGDVGAGADAVAASGPGAFEMQDGWTCPPIYSSPEGDESAAACAGVCHSRSSTRGNHTDCFSWYWNIGTNKCWTRADAPVVDLCVRHVSGWTGQTRRHLAWDVVDTHRDPKRLLTFGLGMPLFGDSSYMLRLPQWIECVSMLCMAVCEALAGCGGEWRSVRAERNGWAQELLPADRALCVTTRSQAGRNPPRTEPHLPILGPNASPHSRRAQVQRVQLPGRALFRVLARR